MKANQKVNEGSILAAAITFKNIFHTAVLVSSVNNILKQICAAVQGGSTRHRPCTIWWWRWQDFLFPFSLSVNSTTVIQVILLNIRAVQQAQRVLKFCHVVLDYIYATSMLQCQGLLRQELPELRMPLKTVFWFHIITWSHALCSA